MSSADADPAGLPRARGEPVVNRGLPGPRERERLQVGFGVALRYERRRLGWGIRTLAAQAGIHERSISRLESGSRRPTVTMIYRLARALRAGADDVAVAALAERLVDAAGPSLRDYRRKPRRRRAARLAAEVRGEGAAEVPADIVADDLAALVLAELAKRTTP